MRPKKLIVAFLLVLGWMPGLWAEARTNSTPQTPSEVVVTIAIFHPSVGTLKALTTLREKGLIPIRDLSVLGLYHKQQVADYSKAREYVQVHHLDWFSFYPFSGPLSEQTIFKRNGCSAEFEKIFNEVDGLIFFGGPDIPPSLYHQKTNLLTEIIDPYRHFLELSFIFHLLGGFQDETFSALLEKRPDFPILGICLGSQSLNVGTGGTLTQDIWSEIYGQRSLEDVIAAGHETWHINPFFRLNPHLGLSSYTLHPIRLVSDGIFCSSMGFRPEDKPLVISEHHQQAEKLGKGFRVIASSLDGKVVEAIEHTRFPHVLGVQFHPEYPDLYSPEIMLRFRPDDQRTESLPSFLAKHPPSTDFHQKFWGWVSRTWAESHHRRSSRTQSGAPGGSGT